jgi:hypothetical protein
MNDVFLLPCPCGKKVSVDAGQAGTNVVCECGTQLAVPRFRAMKELERAKPAPAAVAAAGKGGEWNAFRGILFSIGTLSLVVASVLVCYHLYSYSVMFDGGEAWKQAHLEEMREGVEYLSPVEALHDFQDMATKGLTVDGVPPWSQVTAMRDNSRRWLVTGLVGLAVGIVCMSASLIGAKRSKPR